MMSADGDTTCNHPGVSLENVLEALACRRLKDQAFMHGPTGFLELILHIRDVNRGIINNAVLVILIFILSLLLL